MKTQSKLLAAGLALGLVLCTVQAIKIDAEWEETVKMGPEKAKEKFDPDKAPKMPYDDFKKLPSKNWPDIRNFIENNNIDVNTILTVTSGLDRPLFGEILKKADSYEEVNAILDYFIKHGGNINVHSKDGINLLFGLARSIALLSELDLKEVEKYFHKPQECIERAASKAPYKIVKKFIDLGFTGINSMASVGGKMTTPLDLAEIRRISYGGNKNYRIPNWYELALVLHGARLSKSGKLLSKKQTMDYYVGLLNAMFPWHSA